MSTDPPSQLSVGDTLRMARERAGQDLRYVADMLRIRYAYLEAIEKCEYDKLPGAPYAIGFIRAYADHLDLNSVEIVERFKQESANVEKQTQLVFPKPLPEGKVPSGGILLVGVVLAFLVYGGWLFLSSQDKPIAELIPEIPSRFAELVGIDGDDGAESVMDDDAALRAEAVDESPPLRLDETDGETIEAEDPVQTGRPLPESEPASVPVDSREARVDEPADAGSTAEDSLQAGGADVAASDEAPAVEDASAATPEPETVMEAAVTAAPVESTSEPNGDSNGLNAAAAAQQALAEIEPEQVSEPSADAQVAAVSGAAEETEPTEPLPADRDDTGGLVPSSAPESAADPDAEPVGLSAPSNGSPVAETPGSDAPAAMSGDPDEPAAQVAAAPAAMTTPPGERVYGSENVGFRILITARVDSWVEVSASDGELLLTRVLRAGDSFQVPDRSGLTLVTGNAGGLTISVDGKTVPDIGPVGAVRRGVPLDPDLLKEGTAGNT